jgi:hypothetical protein
MDTHHSWVSYVAVAAGAALLVKAVVIIGSGGEEPGITGLLYLGGLLLALAAAVGAGLRARRGRRALTGVGLGVALVAFVMVLSDALAPLFEVVSDAPWVADEGPVGLLGAVLLALGALGRTREPVTA